MAYLDKLLAKAAIHGTAALIVRQALIFGGVLFISLLANLIAKRFILAGISYIIGRLQLKWGDIFLRKKVFNRLSHIAPALVFYLCAGLIFPDWPKGHQVFLAVIMAYMIFIGAMVVDACLNVAEEIIRTQKIGQAVMMRSLVQGFKIILYLLTAILIISTLMSKSPWAIFGGLGAMTAIILLVFKDSIMGFVASVQLSANNLVQPGDWIEMPKYGADGDVIEVTINTVKVQNWDKTITTIPSYALISDSFKNWRGMSESGGRRIKRAIHIDMNTVKFCNAEMLERFKKIGVLGSYLDEKLSDIEAHNQNVKLPDVPTNRRGLTNLGTFRAYLKTYLRNHPQINQDMTLIIRHLQPTDKGLPIEIYVFSKDQAWVNYEGIQADIFDHILAIIGYFDLRIFQNPTGSDFKNLATLKP